MNYNNEPAFPVAHIALGPQPSLGYFLIRFDFLTNLMQPVDHPNPGRNYLLTPVQARYLAEQILSTLHHLETAGTEVAPGEKH